MHAALLFSRFSRFKAPCTAAQLSPLPGHVNVRMLEQEAVGCRGPGAGDKLPLWASQTVHASRAVWVGWELVNPRAALEVAQSKMSLAQSTVLCKHGAAAVLGTDARGPLAAVTVQGDGVVCYSLSKQVSERSIVRPTSGEKAPLQWRHPTPPDPSPVHCRA